jgi:hypothetical protein
MKAILKNWKTSAIALIIIVGLSVQAWENGITVQNAIFGLIAIGFLATKDADKSHTKK